MINSGHFNVSVRPIVYANNGLASITGITAHPISLIARSMIVLWPSTPIAHEIHPLCEQDLHVDFKLIILFTSFVLKMKKL